MNCYLPSQNYYVSLLWIYNTNGVWCWKYIFLENIEVSPWNILSTKIKTRNTTHSLNSSKIKSTNGKINTPWQIYLILTWYRLLNQAIRFWHHMRPFFPNTLHDGEIEFLSRRGVLDATLCDKVCQLFAAGQRFYPGTPVSSPINLSAMIKLKYCWKWD
jgi:hypothetical protein